MVEPKVSTDKGNAISQFTAYLCKLEEEFRDRKRFLVDLDKVDSISRDIL